MKTFTLYGSTQQPGYAGDWHALMQVQARDMESAAQKLRGKIRDKSRDYGVWFHPGRQTLGIVARVLIAAERMRGRKRREALHEEVYRLGYRYSTFQIVLLPQLA